MTATHEKILYGITVLASSAFAALGAIMTDGESRWLFVTFASSFLMSGFLALMFKRANESIRLVVGRCGFAIFGGIFLTRPAIHYMGIKTAASDIIALAGVASGVCVLTFFVGYQVLKRLESGSPGIARKLFARWAETDHESQR